MKPSEIVTQKAGQTDMLAELLPSDSVFVSRGPDFLGRYPAAAFLSEVSALAIAEEIAERSAADAEINTGLINVSDRSSGLNTSTDSVLAALSDGLRAYVRRPPTAGFGFVDGHARWAVGLECYEGGDIEPGQPINGLGAYINVPNTSEFIVVRLWRRLTSHPAQALAGPGQVYDELLSVDMVSVTAAGLDRGNPDLSYATLPFASSTQSVDGYTYFGDFEARDGVGTMLPLGIGSIADVGSTQRRRGYYYNSTVSAAWSNLAIGSRIAVEVLRANVINQFDRRFIESAPKYTCPAKTDGSVLNGAQWWDGVTSVGKNSAAGGIKFPAGQTGHQSFLRLLFQIPSRRSAAMAGRVTRFAALLRTTADFIERIDDTIVTVSNVIGTAGKVLTHKLWRLDASTLVVQVDYLCYGDETQLGLNVQISNATAFASDQTLKVIRQYFCAIDASGPLVAVPGGTQYLSVIRIKQDGTGDYNNLTDAMAAHGGGTDYWHRVLYEVYEGVHTDLNVVPPEYADIIGVGDRDRIWFRGDQADTIAPALTEANSTFAPTYTGRISNLKITARNLRYAVHQDSGASDFAPHIQIDNVFVEHYGNAGAFDYQTSISGSPGAVWANTYAVGAGLCAGQKLDLTGCVLRSAKIPFYYHDNADFTSPVSVVLDGCEVTSTAGDWAIVQQLYGCGQAHNLTLKNCTLVGDIYVPTTILLTTDPYKYRGNMLSFASTRLENTPGVAVFAVNSGQVLELRSAAGAGSSVFVSGTARDALFGQVPDYRAGGVGLAGRAYSQQAITNPNVANALGARLGNCTVVNKTLDIVFDGAVNVSLVLNQNYTAMTNAQVITALNTLLADGTRGFYASDPYSHSYRVEQPQYVRRLKNTGATAILKGMGVVAGSAGRSMAIAPVNSTAQSVIGVCLADVPPGAWGPVMGSGGSLYHVVLNLVGGIAIGFGDTLQISPTVAGQWVNTNTQGAARPTLKCNIDHAGIGLVLTVL